MDTRLELLSLLLIIASAQGFFLMILLFKQLKKESSNFWLGLLLGLISIAILSQAFEINGLLRRFLILHPQLYGIIDPLVWLFGPFYFFFIFRLLKNRKLRFWEYLIHFFPASIKTLSLISFFALSSNVKLKIIEQSKLSRPGLSSEDQLFMLSILLYLIWATWEIFSFRKKITDKTRINWLWYLNLVMLGAWVFQALALTLHVYQLNPFPQSDYLVILGWVVGIYAIGYIQWTKSPLNKIKEQKYVKSGLDYDAQNLIYEKIKEALQVQKIFKDPELNLKSFANSLQVSPHHLSQVINDQFQLSYYDLISYHRIEEAKRILVDPRLQHLTILAISYEAGFNSKSAFNRAFKKMTGKTPSEFKKL